MIERRAKQPLSRANAVVPNAIVAAVCIAILSDSTPVRLDELENRLRNLVERAASAQFVGNVHGCISGPSFSGIEGNDATPAFPCRCESASPPGSSWSGNMVPAGMPRSKAWLARTPNLAARLQALAEPGAVVISSGTRRLTGGLFDYRDLGTVELKGFAEAVQAWQVLGASIAESRVS